MLCSAEQMANGRDLGTSARVVDGDVRALTFATKGKESKSRLLWWRRGAARVSQSSDSRRPQTSDFRPQDGETRNEKRNERKREREKREKQRNSRRSHSV